MTDRLREAAQRLAAVSEDAIRDEAQGLCVFCGEGWEPGPRGGKAHTNRHSDDCPFDALRNALANEGPPFANHSLDVERLARALRAVCEDHPSCPRDTSRHGADAIEIARAYAEAATPAPDEDGGEAEAMFLRPIR